MVSCHALGLATLLNAASTLRRLLRAGYLLDSVLLPLAGLL